MMVKKTVQHASRFLYRARYIFLAWVLLNIIFGIGYYLLTVHSPENGLLHPLGPDTTASIWDSIYYSFITSAAVGYGDFIPIGFSKFLAIIESLIGILVLTLLISEIIHGEEKELIKKLHGHSVTRKAKEVRSGFYHFRHNIERFVSSVNSKKIPQKVSIDELNLHVLSLNNLLSDLLKTYQRTKRGKREVLRNMNIIIHMTLSLHSLQQALEVFSRKKIDWKKPETHDIVSEILEQTQRIVAELKKDVGLVDAKDLEEIQGILSKNQ